MAKMCLLALLAPIAQAASAGVRKALCGWTGGNGGIERSFVLLEQAFRS